MSVRAHMLTGALAGCPLGRVSPVDMREVYS